MKQSLLILLLLSLVPMQKMFAQNEDSLLQRIQGFSFDGQSYFNVDGIEIIKQTALTNFSRKHFLKKFKTTTVNRSELTTSDSLIPYNNFCLTKIKKECDSSTNYFTEYFIETLPNQVVLVSFLSINKRDVSLERDFLALLLNWKIPAPAINLSSVGTIPFAGRSIPVGPMCRWMAPNNCQCSGNGQMDWSNHKTLYDAKARIDYKYTSLNCRSNGKIIQDQLVDVVFEGTKTQARKLTYDFTGSTSDLVAMTGGKTLTIYLVAATVRNYNVSCMMSFWNNDEINESGLPTLIDQVMALE